MNLCLVEFGCEVNRMNRTSTTLCITRLTQRRKRERARRAYTMRSVYKTTNIEKASTNSCSDSSHVHCIECIHATTSCDINRCSRLGFCLLGEASEASGESSCDSCRTSSGEDKWNLTLAFESTLRTTAHGTRQV